MSARDAIRAREDARKPQPPEPKPHKRPEPVVIEEVAEPSEETPVGDE